MCSIFFLCSFAVGALFSSSLYSGPLKPPPCYLSVTKEQSLDIYTDYDLGDDENGAWGLSICDLHQTAPHFHKKGAGHFIVLSGRVAVTLDGVTRNYSAGDHVYVPKGVVHAFKALETQTPVRLLCVEVPVSDPKDRWPK
tara:strand:+ start:71 stop:490 length:420 start_codon:yes stop_codon:yes gene_type:complete